MVSFWTKDIKKQWRRLVHLKREMVRGGMEKVAVVVVVGYIHQQGQHRGLVGEGA